MNIRTGHIPVSLMAATAPWATYALIMGVAVPMYLSLFVIVAALLRTVSGRELYFGRPVLALLLYVSLTVASIFWTVTPSLWPLWNWVIYFVAFFGALNFLRDIRSLRWFVYATAVGALITLPLLAPYEGQDALTSARYAVDGHNANFTAYVLGGSFFVIALGLRYLGHSRNVKWLLIGVLVIIVFELMLLGTRGAQISIFLSGLTIVWSRWMTKSLARIASISALLLSIAFSLGWLTPVLVLIDSLSARSTGDLSGRLVIWLDAIKFIMQEPFFGIGPGSFVEVGTFRLGVHNIFLLVLLDCGVIGMVVFLWFLFEVRSTMLTFRKDGQRIFFALLMYWLPMAISGHWETAPFSWAVIAFAIQVTRVLGGKKQGVVAQ